MIPAPASPTVAAPPPVGELLDVDREYRRRAAAGALPAAAHHHHALGEWWPPVLHTVRIDRRYTALYSTTPLACRVHRTHDWVLIYERDEDGEPTVEWTVVTEWRGPMRGRRVVRGRELECFAYHRDRRRYRRQHASRQHAITAPRAAGTGSAHRRPAPADRDVPAS